MSRKSRSFSPDLFAKAAVAIGIMVLVGLTIIVLVRQRLDLIPIAVIVLLSVFVKVVEHYFGKGPNASDKP